MPKINQEEYEVLKALDSRAKSIVRQARGWLWVAEQPIMKDEIGWYVEDGFDAVFEDDSLFHFIQWEDREPYNIAELIEEYESGLIKPTPWTPNPLDFESEKTEVKRDSEWMKEEFKKLERTGVIDSWVYRDLWMMANQLDEPEVLSLEWIEEHRKSYTMEDSVEISDLQNLLVPKQEELESTIKVLIEAYKQEEDAHGELENGWIKGFIKDLKNLVEEEPLYYVMNNDNRMMLGRMMDGKTITEADPFKLEDMYEGEKKSHRLTEKEIKDYDERYWPFAVPVEVSE